MAVRTVLLFALLVALAACQRSSSTARDAAPVAPPLADAAPAVAVEAPTPTSQPTGAHMDHRARHGGLLLMNGDLHFEVVFDPAGRHRVYFSDAVRDPLPASVASEVTLTITRKGDAPEELALARSADGASWVSSGRPLDLGAEDVARVAYTRPNAKPYWIDVPVTAPDTDPASARGAAPHKHRHKHTHGAHE